MRNVALFLKYEGTAYHGWQVQKSERTVAETLEIAATAVLGHPVRMTGCGRTDAGVHAKAYVANFRTNARIPTDRIPYALNTHLPDDIAVTGALEVPERSTPSAPVSGRSIPISSIILTSGTRFMSIAHGFIRSIWMKRSCSGQGISLWGLMIFLRCVRWEPTSNPQSVQYTITRLHGRETSSSCGFVPTVFCTTWPGPWPGTVVYAAEGKLQPEEISGILARGDRTAAGPTVPPGGLYLTKLWYDDGEVSFHVGE